MKKWLGLFALMVIILDGIGISVGVVTNWSKYARLFFSAAGLLGIIYFSLKFLRWYNSRKLNGAVH